MFIIYISKYESELLLITCLKYWFIKMFQNYDKLFNEINNFKIEI